MKERQRWAQSKEDSPLHSCVKEHRPREWNHAPQRMNKPIDEDPTSCVESWKNYLKPGIKRGSLSEDEQRLVTSLQGKYGNRWKKIAGQVPGTTAKKLGKWWEVHREKLQDKVKDTEERIITDSPKYTIERGKYDDILEIFAEKCIERQKQLATPASICNLPAFIAATPSGLSPPIGHSMLVTPAPDFTHLAIPSTSRPTTYPFGPPTPCLPPWMCNKPNPSHVSEIEGFLYSSPSRSKSSPSSSLSAPSVALSLSPSSSTPVMSASTASACSSWMQQDTAINSCENNVGGNSEAAKEKGIGNSHVELPSVDPSCNLSSADQRKIMPEMCMFLQHCRELEERQQSWLVNKKETCWRLKRLEQQLEAEKTRKRQEKMEEVECKVRALREEEMLWLNRLESDYREQLSRVHRDSDVKEDRMMEMWRAKHVQLTKIFETTVHRHDPHKSSDESH